MRMIIQSVLLAAMLASAALLAGCASEMCIRDRAGAAADLPA